MAYGIPFSGYAPHPDIPGAYNFTPANGGNPILATGPEADRLRGLIDQSAPQDNRTANLMQQTGVGFGNDPSAVRDFAAGQSAQDFRNQLMGPSKGEHKEAPPQYSHAAAAPQAAQPQATQTAQSGPSALPPPQTQAGAQAQTPMNGGIDPRKMLIATHTKAGWVPTAESIKTKGAVQDPAAQKLEAQAFANQERAAAEYGHDMGQALNAQTVQANLAYREAENQRMKLEADQANLLAKKNAAAEAANKALEQGQSELTAMSQKEVRPNRIFEGKPGAQIAATLAVALGSFGASLNHGPNFALDIINKKIDEDIGAQRDQIARGVNAKQNDLMRIKDKYNISTDAAEKMLGLQNIQYAQVMARRQAAMVGGQQAQIQLAQLDKQLADEHAKRLQDFVNTIQGEVETSTNQKYQQGGTAYKVNPYYEQLEKAEGLGAKMAVHESTIEHQGQTPGKQGTGPGQGPISAKIAQNLAINESAIKDVNNFLKDRPKGFIMPHREGGGLLQTDARTKVNSMARAIVGKLVQGSNGSINETEAEHFYDMLNSPYESIANAGAEEVRRALATTNEGLNKAANASRRGGGGSNEAEAAAEEATP